MDTLEKCTEAVDKIKNEIPNAQFGGSDTSSDLPKGCFLLVADGSFKDIVFFNEHSTGSSNIYARHICEEKGNI